MRSSKFNLNYPSETSTTIMKTSSTMPSKTKRLPVTAWESTTSPLLNF